MSGINSGTLTERLFAAIMMDSIERVRIIISLGADVNAVNADSVSPLCMACKLNEDDIVVELLSAGADPNAIHGDSKKSALHCTTYNTHDTISLRNVKALVQSGANVNAQDWDGSTALHNATTLSDVDVVGFLLENGADINITDVDEETPLVRACFADDVNLVKLFVSHGCDVNESVGLPLEIAVRKSSLVLFKCLIEAGGDVHLGQNLILASQLNCHPIIEQLLDSGIDVNAAGTFGMTALHMACISNGTDCWTLQMLLDRGSRLNQTGPTGDSALHYACENLECAKIRLLLAYKSPLNLLDVAGYSPLLVVMKVRVNCEESFAKKSTAVTLLIGAGARVTHDVIVKSKEMPPDANVLAEKIQELNSLLFHSFRNPHSLKVLCRITIRSAISIPVDHRIPELLLPRTLLEFLNFADIPLIDVI